MIQGKTVEKGEVNRLIRFGDSLFPKGVITVSLNETIISTILPQAPSILHTSCFFPEAGPLWSSGPVHFYPLGAVSLRCEERMKDGG